MIVQYAYIPGEVSLCRKHYDDPPEWLGVLGPVNDARRQHQGPHCVVCEREHSEAKADPEGDSVGPFATLSDALTWAQNNGTADWQWFDGHSIEALARYAYQYAEGETSDELLAAYLTACDEDPRDYSIGR